MLEARIRHPTLTEGQHKQAVEFREVLHARVGHGGAAEIKYTQRL